MVSRGFLLLVFIIIGVIFIWFEMHRSRMAYEVETKMKMNHQSMVDNLIIRGHYAIEKRDFYLKNGYDEIEEIVDESMRYSFLKLLKDD